MNKMSGFVARWLLLGSFVHAVLSCYHCFIDADHSMRLCWGHILTKYNVRNVDSCFEMLDRIFNNDQKVIDAAKVGRGYDLVLKEIMTSEIIPIVEEFDGKKNNDTVYEAVLQAAADKFIIMAHGLPRVSGCFPPCGFQALGAVYNCISCQYDTCEFPLDCPLQEITVPENNGTEMWCKVPFSLPKDIQIVWRSSKVKTVLMDHFKEVTVGVDKLYSIPSVRPEHSGTYQCEIFSQERSLVRIYYYLTVTPRVDVGHVKLQEVFDLALQPGGQFPLKLLQPPFALLWLPSPDLLTVCLTSLLLLFFLIVGVLYWKSKTKRKDPDCNTHRKRYVLTART